MPEPTEQPDINAENQRLRVQIAELTKKKNTYKEKAAAFEATIAERDAANATLQAQYKQVTVDAPMRAMAESMSKVPELFIEQFNKSHRLEMVDGEVTIVNAEDGKPINVAFEREALLKHLIDDKNPQAKTFQSIVIASKASGAGTPTAPKQRPAQPIVSPRRFGLR